MTIRNIPPLDSKMWNQLVNHLNKKPSKTRSEFIKKAVQSGRKFKVHRNLKDVEHVVIPSIFKSTTIDLLEKAKNDPRMN